MLDTHSATAMQSDKTPTDHADAVSDRRSSIAATYQDKLLTDLQAIEEKIQLARQSREALLKDRSDKIHHTTSDTIELAHKRRDSFDQEKMGELLEEALRTDRMMEEAVRRHEEVVERKREMARKSLDDVSAGKARAEMREAIRASAAEMSSQAHQLQEDLAHDRRDSRIEFIKKSQPHLQNHSVPAVEAEVL
ncbi:hypothetical protein HDU67_008018 [Dinochytrium kinnereticum]|nr:hypothetical protein HDU67_008018 [Dinochytrium kinnereticum]